MTDELLYERLAISIAEGGLPRLHGELVGVFALLYPFLLAPVFAIVDQPDAVVVVHAWNGVLFASAAVPAFLLARRLPIPSWAVWASAIFAVALPWSTIAGVVMTEAVAYPAFLWAALAIQRAAVMPADSTYAAALGAIALATVARPQFVVLAVVLLIVAVLEELRTRRGFRPHRVLAVACVLAVVFAAVLATAGTFASALGTYAPTVEEGNVLSREVLRSAVVHLNVVGVAIGIVPLLVGGGWALTALVRPPVDREARTFAALVVASVVVLSLVAASVVVRFGVGIDVKDRYLFYVAPVLFLAAATALSEPRVRIVGLLAATTVFVLTIGWERFEPVAGANLDTPGSITHEVLAREADDLGLAPATLVTIAAAGIAVLLVVALRSLPRGPVAFVVICGTVLATALETGYAWDRLLGSGSPSGRAMAQAPSPSLAWIDRAVPAGADVGLLAYHTKDDWFASATSWWDVEFWNARVTRGYITGHDFTYTPLPFVLPQVTVDRATGRILGEAAPYIVRTTTDARLRHSGPTVATNADYELVQVEQPPRVEWMSTGLDRDGWTGSDRPAAIRVFGGGDTSLGLTIHAPNAPVEYDVGDVVGSLAPLETRELTVLVCVPQGGFADVPVRVRGGVRIRDVPDGPAFVKTFRTVGARLTHISARPSGRAC